MSLSSSPTSCHCQATAGSELQLHPRCFGQLWLFDGLSPQDRELLTPSLVRQTTATGQILFRQGDLADRMFLLKGGSVKLSKVTEEGRALTLDIRKAGDLLGETVFIEESEFPVTATCLEPTRTCGISKAILEATVLKHPTVGLALIRNLSHRIQSLTAKVGALTEPNLEDRMYQVLVNVAQQVGLPRAHGWSLEFPLSHEEIGFLVGAHRVSVTRVMARLRESGKIRLEGKRIQVMEIR